MLHIVTSVTYSKNSLPAETHYICQAEISVLYTIISFNRPIIPRRLALL